MLYLSRFRLPEREAEELYWGSGAPKTKRTCYDSNYPFGLFLQRPVPPLDFEPVTILYGGNGSGKSTILNLIAHCLRLPRGTDCNTSAFFADYAALCRYEAQRLPEGSRILTSDDVFAAVLSLRADSGAVDAGRETLLEDYRQLRREPRQLASLEDYAEFRRSVDAKRLTQSKFVRAHLAQNPQERSNGESALRFFTKAIREQALYLLDEPENSLSAALQQELAAFLEDSVRFFGCQLVLATHSPFLLALRGAKIYDLDASPIRARRWSELENVRSYYDFFRAHRAEFEETEEEG